MTDLVLPEGTIQFGSRGEAVRDAQILLNAHGAVLRIDGTFGPLTHAATLSFQGTHDLVPNGLIGTATWRALRTPPEIQTIPVSAPGSQALIVSGRFDIERLLHDWYGAGKTQAQCGVLLYDYMLHTEPWSSMKRRGVLALALEVLR